jgi:hypothetical protein
MEGGRLSEQHLETGGDNEADEHQLGSALVHRRPKLDGPVAIVPVRVHLPVYGFYLAIELILFNFVIMVSGFESVLFAGQGFPPFVIVDFHPPIPRPKGNPSTARRTLRLG